MTGIHFLGSGRPRVSTTEAPAADAGAAHPPARVTSEHRDQMNAAPMSQYLSQITPTTSEPSLQHKQQKLIQQQKLQQRAIQSSAAFFRFIKKSIVDDLSIQSKSQPYQPNDPSAVKIAKTLAPLVEMLNNPTQSPFRPTISTEESARLLHDLGPDGVLTQDLLTEKFQTQGSLDLFLSRMNDYVKALIQKSKSQPDQVKTALAIFPPQDRIYLCAGGTTNRLYMAKTSLEQGPRASLMNIYNAARDKAVSKMMKTCPPNVHVHLPRACDYLLGIPIDVVSQTDPLYYTALPSVDREALWSLYQDMANFPKAIHDEVEALSLSVCHEAPTQAHQQQVYKPWGLTAFTGPLEDFELSYKTPEAFKAAIFDQVKITLGLNINDDLQTQASVELKPMSLQELASESGMQWFLQQFDQSPGVKNPQLALQGLYALAEGLASSPISAQYLKMLGQLGGQSEQRPNFQAGLNTLTQACPNDPRVGRLYQRLNIAQQAYPFTHAQTQAPSDKDVIDYFQMLQGSNHRCDEFLERLVQLNNPNTQFAQADAMVHKNNGAFLSKLGERIDLNHIDPHGRLLYTAVQMGADKAVQGLIDARVSLDQAYGRYSALALAVAYGRESMVEMLIDAGANINPLQAGFPSPLTIAAQQGRVSLTKRLCQERAQINTGDHHQRTAAYGAVEAGQVQTLEVLLKNKADLTKADDRGNTPLHIAAASGNVQILKMLLDKDTSCMTRSNDQQKTPLMVAVENGHVDAAKLLLEQTRSSLGPMAEPIRQSALDLAHLLNQRQQSQPSNPSQAPPSQANQK